MNTLEALETLGVPRTHVGVIKVLMDNKPHSMHEIERIADLRQPEVSVAVTAIDRFVGVGRVQGATGRPRKIVLMTPDGFKKYTQSVVKEAKVRMIKENEAIKSLGG